MKLALSRLAAVVAVTAAPVFADEGMWLLNGPPTALLKDRYGFVPGTEWLEHLQKSCARVGGASGSLVSAGGLLMTNHHVGLGQIFKLSTPQRDLVAGGFYARTRAEELKCPDMEVRVLWSIEDVTDQVNAAGAGLDPAKAYDARRKAMTAIEQKSKDATGLDSEVITLYHGARYHLYRYRLYKDVRLVMAPEKSIAFFGGDTDNFEYPRFDLDCSFFRIYENDQPLRPEHYLRLSAKGAAQDDLAFVLGHPARTRRLLTVDHLRFLRDIEFPATLRRLWRREVQLANFCDRDREHTRIGSQEFWSYQNGRKARTGGYVGLLDPALMQAKEKTEVELRGKAASRPSQDDPWARIAAAEREYTTFYNRHQVLSELRGFDSRLFEMARTIVRLGDELPKPSGDRLREYRDSELESVYFDLYSPAPIYEAFEIENMSSSLQLMAELFGGEDPAVVTAMAGMPPAQRAAQLVKGCTLRDIDTRKKLLKEGKDGVAASTDPMIRLAAALDAEARALRKRYEDQIEGVERLAYAEIAARRFAIFGESVYPDATGTLRLAFGKVTGYEEDGRRIPAMTTFEGLYARSQDRGNTPPFQLPARWTENRGRLQLATPLNFVLTADIIGGNSGSPVVNTAGEVVGLIFDGNLSSLAWDFAFEDRIGRAIAVDIRGITEALRVIYDAAPLVDELTRKK